jgi:alpha-beta hydrolase superfamily lysophospholipase
MASEKCFYFPSSDGIHSCYAKLWLPECPPRAVIQFAHGVADHIDRYDEFARYLAEHGFAVCGNDHLGHGKTGATDSIFGYFAKHDGWTLVAADIYHLRQQVGQEFPDIPYFLLGHSMGSFLTRTYLCRYPGTVDGAILSGTGQEPHLKVLFGKAVCSLCCLLRGTDKTSQFIYDLSLGAYNKPFEPGRTNVDWISRDEQEVDRYQTDPFCGFQPTVGLMRDMMDGLLYFTSPRALSQMNPQTPIYLYSGDADPVGENGAGVRRVADTFRKYACADITLKLYPGGRHEMHNELNREEVFADVLSWLEVHL